MRWGGLYLPDAENDAIAAPGTDVGTLQNRTRHIVESRPEVCSLDVTTQNQMDGDLEYVYLHSQSTLRRMARTFLETGVKQSVLLGGHARVGLEDNLYLERGVFATNGQLVERAVRIIRDVGCEVATPDEAREMLGLGRTGASA